MNFCTGILAAAVATLSLCAPAGVHEDFACPPESTRLQMWYHWVGDCVTREGLVRDFRAFGEIGVDIVHIISPSMAKLPKTAVTMSPEWLDLFAFAICEAKKNGIRLSFHNCPGWSSSGGPWISPENSMKVVVASEVDVTSGMKSVRVPQPMTRCGFYRDIAVFALPQDAPVFKALEKPVPIPIKDEGSVFAATYESWMPLKPSKMVLKFFDASFHADCTVAASSDGREWSKVGCAKFRFNKAPTPKIVRLEKVPDGSRFFRLELRHAPPLPWLPSRNLTLERVEFNSLPLIDGIEVFNSTSKRYGYHPELSALGKGFSPSSVVDLSSSLAEDGTLDLESLEANEERRTIKNWRIVRIGYTSKGVGPGPSTIDGLECDKLDRKGIEAHWAGMPAKILALPGAKGTVVETFIDSFEVGGQNWSENLADEFLRRRGYPIGKNLLSACGYLLEDGAATARFLWDFQRTIGELFAENYYDRFAELCRENGIRAAAQTYGGPFDPMRAARNMDEPQGEYWMSGTTCGNSPRLMASVAHLYGKRFASAESFTSEQAEGRWLASPHWFRTVGDRYGWLNGINRIVCHSYCHQPFPNVIPGISLGRHGSQFTVNSTWWKEGRFWHDYVRRGQALLQYGRPRAEVLILGNIESEALLRAGFNYDICSEYDVAALEPRPDGFGMPGQPSYRMLVVPSSVQKQLGDETCAKLSELAASGVPVAYGDAMAAVRKAKLRAPFEEPSGALRAIRREGEADETIWFVVNATKKPFAGEATFLARPGTRPEFFDAKTGEITPVEFRSPADDRFALKLELMSEGSTFVVFTKNARPPSVRTSAASAPVDLSTGWTITSFDGRNAPAAPLALDRLVDWSQSDDPKLRYFSGRAVYERKVSVARTASRAPLTLDLGEVHEIANVFVDGKFVACLWEQPYRVTIPLQSSTRDFFDLRLEVVNLMPNRMIGDAIALRNGAKEELSEKGPWPKWVLEGRPDSGTGIFSWTNFRPAWTADDKPLASGLLGPVKLCYDKDVPQ